VDDLLDVTRIVRGKVELRRTDLDIAELTRRIADDHRKLMMDRELHFDIEAPHAPVWVNGDETRLAQVIGNLLQNAAKFTPEGGSVTLSVISVPDAVEVQVRDTGSGIEPELLAKVFDPFVQAKQSLARTHGGLGLGLALVKALVEMHDGTVTVESDGRDRGAVFTVKLPAVATASPSVDAPARADSRPADQMRVLVVDDHKDAAESLADLVRMLGHEAEVAFDGETAVRRVTTNPPDMVLCDIGLPGMSGYQVAEALRRDERFDSVQLVAVTGYAQPEDRQRALDAGFADHIAKPADPARVLTLLRGGKK
jgi:CheY-like chemotaxis protein